MVETTKSNDTEDNGIGLDLQKSIAGIESFLNGNLIGEIQKALSTISDKKEFSQDDLDKLSKVYEDIQASAKEMGVSSLLDGQMSENSEELQKQLDGLREDMNTNKKLLNNLYSFIKGEFEKIHIAIANLERK